LFMPDAWKTPKQIDRKQWVLKPPLKTGRYKTDLSLFLLFIHFLLILPAFSTLGYLQKAHI